MAPAETMNGELTELPLPGAQIVSEGTVELSAQGGTSYFARYPVMPVFNFTGWKASEVVGKLLAELVPAT